MAITLSDEDATKVLNGRKSDRPTWFSATRQKDIKISEDFEAFLILSSTDAKKKGAEWVTKFANKQKPDKKRGDLLKEWCDNEQADADKMKDDTNKDLKDFTDWRDKFSAGKFGGVAEVGALVNDLSYLIDEIVFRAGNYAHASIAAKIQSGKIAAGQKTEDQVKQSQSWTGPLLAY